MARYVDAEKLENDGWSASRTYQQDAKTMVYETAKMTDFPTADVVEVVRCKDCENWESDWSSCADENKHYCVMIDGFTVADFYCGYGEQKDGADE